jgi:hypothetical protein
MFSILRKRIIPPFSKFGYASLASYDQYTSMDHQSGLSGAVTKDEVLAYVRTVYPSGKGGEGYRKNLVTFLKTVVNRPINSTLLLEIPSKNKEKQNYCNRRWEEVYSNDRLPFVNWRHPLGKDRGLKHEEWCLLSLEPISEEAGRGVNKKITSQVFMRDNSTCTRCGAKAGEHHHMFPDKLVHLHVGHLVPFIKEDAGKKYTAADFTTLCSMCNEGEKADTLTREQKLDMLRKQREAIDRSIAALETSQGAS